MNPSNNPLYVSDLTARLIARIDSRIASEAKLKGLEPPRIKGRRDPRFSIRELSIRTGINYYTLYDYVGRRCTPIPVTAIDSILYALGLSVTDLLQTDELAVLVDTLPAHKRYRLRKRNHLGVAIDDQNKPQKALDNGLVLAQNQGNAPVPSPDAE